MYKEYNFTIEPGKTKERLDLYLTRSLKGVSRSQIKRLIDEEKVLVDERPVKAGYVISPGNNILVHIPLPVLPKALPENIPVDIIYQDENLALVNKPAGMIVHPSPDTFSGTLVNALLYHIKDLSGINGELRPGIVHRLDKGTTGIIIVSKNDKSHRNLSYQFAARKMHKVYWTIVWGRVRKKEGTIESYLKRSRKDIRKMTEDPDGKHSITAYRVMEEFQFLTFVEVKPLTGRTHQIRTHFASVGHPIFGDLLYGGRNKKLMGLKKKQYDQAVELLGKIERQALHAYELGFFHPETGEYNTFNAPLAEDMEEILVYLRGTKE
ncbi:RluA family pseudouridine synthase [candidate division KSB1 bacterium]